MVVTSWSVLISNVDKVVQDRVLEKGYTLIRETSVISAAISVVTASCEGGAHQSYSMHCVYAI